MTTHLGFGLGLRAEYYQEILKNRPPVDWFEIISEDYLIPGGRPLFHMLKIREHYPMVMHGVSLSIGSTDPLNQTYLIQLKKLMQQVEPAWISDHLCWTGVNGAVNHDLLPLPYTEEALQHVVARVKQVQEILGRQIALENVSSYITYNDSSMTEWEFLVEVAKQADCKILLDVNNIYVSAYNHHFDPLTYLNAVPVEKVQQFHIAGHSNLGDIIIDTHDSRVIPDVWQLYEKALQRFGMVSTLLERDDRMPPFNTLLNELNKARLVAKKALAV